MARVALLTALSLCCGAAIALHIDRCQLAETLLNDHGFKKCNIPDWVCLVASESSYDTAARHRNVDGSTDFGLFQINDNWWCHNAAHPGGRNLCGIDCSQLLDDNITDDLQCAEMIYDQRGFNAWYGWILRCRGQNLSRYTRGCNL